MTVETLPFIPLCMEPEELARWQEMRDRSTSQSDRAALPCRDCLAGFAAEMRAVGRCNGTPHGVEEDTEMEPRRFSTGGNAEPNIEDAIAPRGLTITRKVQLEVAAPPCPSCAHEPVCVLRLALEDLESVETAAPPLPAGLRFSLAATISCDHFLRDRAKPAPVRALTSQERGQANGPAVHRTLNLTPEQRALRSQRTTAMNLARAAAREGAASA